MKNTTEQKLANIMNTNFFKFGVCYGILYTITLIYATYMFLSLKGKVGSGDIFAIFVIIPCFAILSIGISLGIVFWVTSTPKNDCNLPHPVQTVIYWIFFTIYLILTLSPLFWLLTICVKIILVLLS